MPDPQPTAAEVLAELRAALEYWREQEAIYTEADVEAFTEKDTASQIERAIACIEAQQREIELLRDALAEFDRWTP